MGCRIVTTRWQRCVKGSAGEGDRRAKCSSWHSLPSLGPLGQLLPPPLPGCRCASAGPPRPARPCLPVSMSPSPVRNRKLPASHPHPALRSLLQMIILALPDVPDMYVPTSSRQCSIRQRETEPAARSFSNAPLPSATAQPPGFPLRLGLLASFFRAGFRLLRFPTLWDPGARADGAGSVRSSCPCPSCHCPLDIGDSYVKISGSVPGVNISSSTEHLPVST